MSIATLLATQNHVKVFDVNLDRLEKIKNKESTVFDPEIQHFFDDKDIELVPCFDISSAYEFSEYVVIATPTDYNTETNYFDTSSVEEVIEDIFRINKNAFIIIKSTVPVGFTKQMQRKFKTERIVFSPEFLREGFALKDNLNPSRIVVGSTHPEAKIFANLLKSAAIKKNVTTIFMQSGEAEAVKLFANTFLAMRVSFFNELDSYAMQFGLDTGSIIKGVSADKRIETIIITLVLVMGVIVFQKIQSSY